jgi:hypothetical protein
MTVVMIGEVKNEMTVDLQNVPIADLKSAQTADLKNVMIE